MLAKLTRGNQLTIPKPIVRQAGLREGAAEYLDVQYVKGIICLKPVDVEERIPPEAYERLLEHARRIEPGDVVLNEREAANFLRRRMKRR